MDTIYTDLIVTSGNDAVTISGDMKIAINQASVTRNTVAITGQNLQTTERNGSTIATRTLTAYSLNGSTDGLTTTRTSSFNLSGNIPSLGQFAYTVKNDDGKPFVTVAPANSTIVPMPSSGTLTVTGNASTVSVTAIDANNVTVTFNGGTSTALTWAALLSLI